MNNSKNLKMLSPFVMCCQKVIPLAFDESMSYYECLCALYDYLKSKVIPALNENIDAIIELQNYIENYFENLDVQEEINNKLDEMAESGELADIIAQYVNVQSVLAYDTTADLMSAENVVNGSICRTLGSEEYSDGLGAYYKIRNITIDDVIDGVNIIAITNSETLIAEKIKESTTLEIVAELPLLMKDNTEFEEIQTEDNINIQSFPVSNYELYTRNVNNESENEDNDIIFVATWNIENSDVPYNIGLAGLEKQNKLKNIFNKIGCSIIGLNETFDGYLYPANKVYTTDFLKNGYFGKTATALTNLNYGNTTVSSKTSSSTTVTTYTNVGSDGEKRNVVKNVYSINGKTLSHYNTHLTYDDNTIPAQLTQLYNLVTADTNDYIVISGDFNFDLTNSGTFLSSFINDGYKIVNNGSYHTYPSSNFGIDQIMVSGNINIIDSGMLTLDETENLSDHLPLYAHLKLN